MPAPRVRRVYSPWSNVVVQTGWSVSSVRSALSQHEVGDFSSSGMLIDMLGRDDRLGSVDTGVIGTRANGLLGKPFSLNPVNDKRKAKKIAEEIEAVWWDILPESELKVMLRYMWLGGGAPAELVWERKNGRWIPRVKPWQLHNLYREEQFDSEQLVERWWLQSRSGQVDFTPGDGKWLLLSSGERWWLNGSVRSLAVPWLGKQFAFRDWLRHSERLGHPVIKAIHPAMSADTEVDGWYDDLKALAAETTAKLPANVDGQGTSFDLQLLEASGQNWQSFEALMKHVNTLYAIHVLGHNLTTEVAGGSFAAANTGNDVRIDYQRSDAETLSTILREQLLKPLCSEWYSGGSDLAPWPRWDVEPESNQKEGAETAKLAGEALQALQLAGYQPRDLDAWAEQYGLELEPMSAASAAPQKPEVVEPELEPELELRLASGDAVGDVLGLVGGQQLVDKLVDEGVPLAVKAMAPDIRKIMHVVDGVIAEGGDYQLMNQRLVELYRELRPSKLAALLEKAEILAELKGMASVLEDL